MFDLGNPPESVVLGLAQRNTVGAAGWDKMSQWQKDNALEVARRELRSIYRDFVEAGQKEGRSC